jgi:hypothetical protein
MTDPDVVVVDRRDGDPSAPVIAGPLCGRCEQRVGYKYLRTLGGDILSDDRFCGICLPAERMEFMSWMVAAHPAHELTAADVAALAGLIDIPTWSA